MTARTRDDSGFGILETVISLALITVVMAAVTNFFVVGVNTGRWQQENRTAARQAADAMNQLSGIKGTALFVGRDQTSTHTAWLARPAAVLPYLTSTAEAWDSSAAANIGSAAAVPTTAKDAVVDGITYKRQWYLGKCWTAPAGGACQATGSATDVPMIRIVVLVTWPDRICPSGTCSFVTASLVSGVAVEPLFPA